MKRFPSVLTALATVGLVAGTWMASANPVAASTPNSSIHGTISFWNAYNNSPPTPNEGSVLTGKVIPAFEKLYPKIKVNNLTLPYNGMFQKLVTQMPSGTGPDIFRSDIIWVPQLAQLGYLQPLDGYSWFKGLASQVFRGTLTTNVWKRKHYGMSLDTNTRVLIYNKTVLHEAKISGPPKTVAEFLADCSKVKKYGHGVYCYAEGGTGGWNVMPWVWSFGGALTDKHFTKATGYFNDSKSVAAIQMLVNLLNEGKQTPTILGSGIGTTDCLGKGDCAFIVDGPWMHPILAGAYPHLNYGFATMPAGAGGTASVVGGEDIAISKFSKNKAADQAFLQFMLSKKAQTLMGGIGQMPVLKSLAGNKGLPTYFKIFQKQLLTAKPRTPSPQWNNIDSTISTAVQQALRKQGTVKSDLTAAAKTIDNYLK